MIFMCIFIIVNVCIYLLLLMYVYIFQNLHHPGVVNLEKMFETPERVSSKLCKSVNLLVLFVLTN